MNEYKSFYKKVGGNEGNLCYYPIRLDVYGKGCQHDCKYCYAKSLLSFRKMWNPIEPAVADIEKVYKKVDKIPAGTILRLGGMTDCFQPIELKYRNTYKLIKKLNEKKIGYLIVTKSDMVAWDEYIEIMDKNLAHIQVTTTFEDTKIMRKYEKAPAIEKRVNAIEKLYKLGFDVAMRVSPFIPEFISSEFINNVKCDKVLIEFLRVNSWIKKWFDIDYSKYTLKYNGYLHLPLQEKINFLQGINKKEMSVCEDVEEHYYYWKEHYNFNKNDCCNLRKADV